MALPRDASPVHHLGNGLSIKNKGEIVETKEVACEKESSNRARNTRQPI